MSEGNVHVPELICKVSHPCKELQAVKIGFVIQCA